MIWAVILIPLSAAAGCFFVPSHGLRRVILVIASLAHAVIVGATWLHTPRAILAGWFAIDPLARLFLSITSALFLMAAFYAVGYLRTEPHGRKEDFEEETAFVNAPEAVFTGCLLLFLATMTMVITSQHFGILWVAMEATTLVSAPLIYFHRHHRSLEATWKYLLVCSVGIAMSLLGNFFLAIAASSLQGVSIPLVHQDLIAHAPQLLAPWLRAAFIFFVVGYGTKMGLAPLHTWLPDAHSEAPSLVSALLSGALLNCAFVGILRAFEVVAAAGLLKFGQDILVLFGLVSMTFAAVFIVGQTDYKRLLAYSSVEHMGILALGVGLGAAAVFGSMLHAVSHSLAKAALFLVAGNILAAYKTKTASDVQGVLAAMPASGVLWVAGILAITGFPPFGTFLSEFVILKSALDQGRYFVAAAYLAILAIIFAGVSAVALRMVQGHGPAAVLGEPRREHLWAIVPPALLIAGVLTMGIFIPAQSSDLLHRVASVLGGQ